jgi:hypothetical protein
MEPNIAAFHHLRLHRKIRPPVAWVISPWRTKSRSMCRLGSGGEWGLVALLVFKTSAPVMNWWAGSIPVRLRNYTDDIQATEPRGDQFRNCLSPKGCS